MNTVRARALRYLGANRVSVEDRRYPYRLQDYVNALIMAAPGDRSGQSVQVGVTLEEGVWECDEHPGNNICAHRYAVQLVTGYGDLAGAPRAMTGGRGE